MLDSTKIKQLSSDLEVLQKCIKQLKDKSSLKKFNFFTKVEQWNSISDHNDNLYDSESFLEEIRLFLLNKYKESEKEISSELRELVR